jgi:hypothetical protein
MGVSSLLRCAAQIAPLLLPQARRGRADAEEGMPSKAVSAFSIDRFARDIHRIRQNISALFEAFPKQSKSQTEAKEDR